MPSDQNILVINYTAPEINHLAAALAETGRLKRYVRPYANQGRGWERLLERMPGLGAAYRKTLGRRVLPSGFAPAQIRETAVPADFAMAALGKVPGTTSKDLADRLHWHVQRRLSRVGARASAGAEAVVATCVVAREAFEATEGKRILNYPIAHHRYSQRLLAEEAALEPTFASTLPDWSKAPAWLEPRVDRECELADSILVGSTFARASFEAEGVSPEKLVVIPYGADATRFCPADLDRQDETPKSASHDFRVLFVGQLSQRKGLSYLLRAYQAFRGCDTQLTLVGNFRGDPGALAPYRAMFRHIPNVPQDRLADLYREADVFVFPTLVEGLPLVLLEAMATSLPIIATPNGPADLVRDGVDGFIVPIRDPEGIAEKLEYLRTHPEERVEMGQNARRRALEFTWSAYREKAVRFLLG